MATDPQTGLPMLGDQFNPAGWTKGGGNSGGTIYTDANGNLVTIDAHGKVILTRTPEDRAKTSGDYASASDIGHDLWNETKGVFDPANLLGGDPALDAQRQEAFDMLKNAAGDFQHNYNVDRFHANESRGMDMDTIARLRAAEEGKTPSAAEALMRKAIDQNSSQALGLAATLGGSNPGMALRAGLEAQQSGGARSAADIAALRAKEEEAARAMLADQTAKGRATDTGAATATGGQFAGIVSAPYTALTNEKAANQAFLGSLAGAGGAAIASDIRGKRDVQPAPEMADAFLSSVSPEEKLRLQVAARAKEQGSPYVHANGDNAAADDFLSTLKPQSFEYKAPDGKNKKPGKRMGVMAQDLPKHDVVTAPDGKKWISADVINDVLAGVGRLHDRVGALEGGQPAAKPAPAQGDAMAQPMIPREAVHDYLASLGITAP